METLEILYRDEHYVAVHKPAGLLVHRSPIDSRETRFLLQMLRNQIEQRVYPVHRLDRPTQGAIVLALQPEAASRLQELLQNEGVEKTYLAIVRGHAPSETLVDHPLLDRRDSRIERREHKHRDAVTHVRSLNTMELSIPVGRYDTARYSLVECRPITGRRHQIRRHMKHLRHPIIGDASYGDGPHNRLWRDQLRITGLLLAATDLRFTHPYSGERVSISAQPASPMRDALQLPQWSTPMPTGRPLRA